jgi:hypothetical protein
MKIEKEEKRWDKIERLLGEIIEIRFGGVCEEIVDSLKPEIERAIIKIRTIKKKSKN